MFQVNNQDVISSFNNVYIKSINGKPAIYKPLILLFAISRCYLTNQRLIEFSVIDSFLEKITIDFFEAHQSKNFYIGFGRLENDGIWEIVESKTLRRTSSGDLYKKELLQRHIKGGFIEEIYKRLFTDKNLLLFIFFDILEKNFDPQIQYNLRVRFGMPEKNVFNVNNELKERSLSNYDLLSNKKLDALEELTITNQYNHFISYLNSLHNLNPNGANALAESQALNAFFSEIYEPFPLADDLEQALNHSTPCVVILTGHAGDGKSTVALDILKRFRNISADSPLSHALKEIETVTSDQQKISIVKDMSELSSDQRQHYLDQAFNQPGSWLIISNTGPLINSLTDFVSDHDLPDHIESQILESIDKPYVTGQLAEHRLHGFNKELIILNMTRLNNVSLGAKVLSNLIKHSAWQHCASCDIHSGCPIYLNRQALFTHLSAVEERVLWVYQRLTAYEQRLTLRQMIAHLALSITGGLNCEEAIHRTKSQSDQSSANHELLEFNLFSDVFFGYRKAEKWQSAEALRAISLIQRTAFAGPASVIIERHLITHGQISGLQLPDTLKPLKHIWHKRASVAAGVRWRFALRRMFYIFGQTENQNDEPHAFLNAFLQSPQLIQFNIWQTHKKLTLGFLKNHHLTKRCLQVLLEIYSGFNAGQYENEDTLYLTLRRSDKVIIQPTQLVVATLKSDDFKLGYDEKRLMPQLIYKQGKAVLPLSLPLLDYIYERSVGHLGSGLSPIHLAQLEWFRSELLDHADALQPEVIGLLRSGIDGRVKLYRYGINQQNQRLEKY